MRRSRRTACGWDAKKPDMVDAGKPAFAMSRARPCAVEIPAIVRDARGSA